MFGGEILFTVLSEKFGLLKASMTGVLFCIGYLWTFFDRNWNLRGRIFHDVVVG